MPLAFIKAAEDEEQKETNEGPFEPFEQTSKLRQPISFPLKRNWQRCQIEQTARGLKPRLTPRQSITTYLEYIHNTIKLLY